MTPDDQTAGRRHRAPTRRAWPADGQLARYFVLSAVGPSIHSTLEVRTLSEGCACGDLPTWLMRQCQVGLLISRLPAAWRDVVVARWSAWVAQEDARRVWQVAMSRVRKLERQLEELRARDGAKAYRSQMGELERQLGEARKLAGVACEESSQARTRRRRLELQRPYQRGMAQLSAELVDVETVELLVERLRTVGL